jgi:15-cis-phytoene synthase
LTATVPTLDLTLSGAYKVCRETAKREAQNFYYAFIALPNRRRNAICAIYAFMREADDIADDESSSIADRRQRLEAWLDSWHTAARGGATSSPVFFAVRDAVGRFRIPLTLLDELVAGVAMDLQQDASGAPETYPTFRELYRYCYLVASVVGLVCIRIFGYRDLRAERLAEETGIAFQLTNILRDIQEDAARNRVYLPLRDLDAHQVSLESLLHRPRGMPPTIQERALLAAMGRRAERFYGSAHQLLPLIDRESRPALWVLVSIYRALLGRIQRADYDVFSRRASVPLRVKLTILCAGMVRMAWTRVFR